jgi:hypothetical protein
MFAIEMQEEMNRLMYPNRRSVGDRRCTDHTIAGQPNPCDYGVSYQYIYLDSWEKLESSNLAEGEIEFNFSIQGATKNQNIGVGDMLSNVIGMTIDDFHFPVLNEFEYISNDATPLLYNQYPRLVPKLGAPPAGSLTQMPFFDTILLGFRELFSQSYSTRNNGRFHFELESTLSADGKSYKLSPGLVCPIFNFTEKINDINGLTLVFRTPDYPLTLQEDVFYDAVFRINGVELEIYKPGHGLLTHDRIYIEGFNTTDPVMDRYMNRKEGHLVGNAVTSTTFYLNPNPNMSGYGAPGTIIPSTSRIMVKIAKRRILIPMSFKRLVSRATNQRTV